MPLRRTARCRRCSLPCAHRPPSDRTSIVGARGVRTPDLFAAVNAPRPFDGDPTGSSGPADGTVATTDHRHTFAAKVAAMFKAAPGEWIDGREVLKIGGVYGWRTRISDCRRAPYN